MRLCLMIEGQEGVTWPQWLALARTPASATASRASSARITTWASAAGCPGGSLDAWTTLAGLAARTERIRLGTMVSPATFRHPSVLGAGGDDRRPHLGRPRRARPGGGLARARARRLRLPVPAARRAHGGVRGAGRRSSSASGRRPGSPTPARHYRLDACDALPLPVQRPHPPLIVGGSGRRRSVAVAVRLAQEYNLVSGTAAECPRAAGAAGRGVRARGPRSGDARALDDDHRLSGRIRGRCPAPRAGDDRPRASRRATRRRSCASTATPGCAARSRRRRSTLAELRAAGVERMMLQHLLHDDLEAVALMGTDLAAAIS